MWLGQLWPPRWPRAPSSDTGQSACFLQTHWAPVLPLSLPISAVAAVRSPSHLQSPPRYPLLGPRPRRVGGGGERGCRGGGGCGAKSSSALSRCQRPDELRGRERRARSPQGRSLLPPPALPPPCPPPPCPHANAWAVGEGMGAVSGEPEGGGGGLIPGQSRPPNHALLPALQTPQRTVGAVCRLTLTTSSLAMLCIYRVK